MVTSGDAPEHPIWGSGYPHHHMWSGVRMTSTTLNVPDMGSTRCEIPVIGVKWGVKLNTRVQKGV